MKTIKEIITRINYLENNGKQIQKEQGDNYWLKDRLTRIAEAIKVRDNMEV